MRDGPLDMRMDTSRGETAAQWLSHADLQDIAGVLKEYGEERFARRIAAAIVDARTLSPIETTSQLARVVSDAHPQQGNENPEPTGGTQPNADKNPKQLFHYFLQ